MRKSRSSDTTTGSDTTSGSGETPMTQQRCLDTYDTLMLTSPDINTFDLCEGTLETGINCNEGRPTSGWTSEACSQKYLRIGPEESNLAYQCVSEAEQIVILGLMANHPHFVASSIISSLSMINKNHNHLHLHKKVLKI